MHPSNDKKDRPVIWIVNQFAGTPESGWGERHFFLSEKFKEKGYRVVIISSGNNHMFRKQAEMNGLFTHENYEGTEFYWVKIPKYNPRSASRFVAMFYFAYVVRFLKSHTNKIGKPDYIILSSMSLFPVPAVLYLKRKLKAKKFIFEVRDLWPLTPIHLMGYSPKHPFIRMIAWFEKKGYKKADEIVSVLVDSWKYINKISGKPEKFSCIPNGISHKEMKKAMAVKPAELNIPEDRLVIIYTGTIGFANAMDPFIDFIADQGDLQERLFFLIIGDGYLKEDYQDKLKEVPNVQFIPKVPKSEVQSYLSLADVCFLAWHKSELYEYGVSANKYYDYMASGSPILAAQSGINDPVLQSGCGLVVANSSNAIRKGVENLLSMSPEQRTALGEKGLNYVQEFTYLNLGERYLEIIER